MHAAGFQLAWRTLNRAIHTSNARPCFATRGERNSCSGARVERRKRFIARLAQTSPHVSHELACHFIAPRAANVTFGAQWRVSQPPKHAALAGRLSIRQRPSHWRESPVQPVARKYARREPSIISSSSRRLVLAGWAPFIRHATNSWIG